MRSKRTGSPSLYFENGLAKSDVSGWVVRDTILCADGFEISVQASRTHYCEPREDHGPWSRVECGFPTAMPEPWACTHERTSWGSCAVRSEAPDAAWQCFAEDEDRPTDTVYGYVPVSLVDALIASHGGLKK
jgi:hypothetical protein